MGLEENNVHGAIPMPELDRCVACGLCLPVCPTYQQLQVESASPRGRLALIRGLLKRNLPESADISKPLSLCLQCRACEQACPAGVQFGLLIDTAKQHWLTTHPRKGSPAEKCLFWLTLRSPRQKQWLTRFFRAVQKTGLIKLVKITGIARLLRLNHLLDLVPTAAPGLKLAEYYKSTPLNTGEVYLFTGCVGQMLDPETLRASISVLTKLGFDVRVPSTQVCCGALHLHEGDFDNAQTLAQKNIAAFGDAEAPIISVVSGCGTALSEYGHLDTIKGKSFESRVTDINTFLTAITWPADATLKPLAAKALVQDACSLRNGLRAQASVYNLLKRIPQLEVQELDDNATCCGGAGTYPIREPEMALTLRNKKIDTLMRQSADFLVTANLGCALHIASGLKNGKLEVVHPV
ncbi:MAG: (Fe-S)-binding protein, partial [Acidiferrobacterales bacterium]